MYMSRVSKILAITIVVLFVLACNFVTQPVSDAQNLAKTAQALGTSIPIETLQALPSLIPAETLQALPSALPTFEALATNIGNMLNPQGAPIPEWNGIPIMPQATAGQEFSANNTYSFKATATAQEVQDFYNEKLTALGWTQPFKFPAEGNTAVMVFQKENGVLTITITTSDNTTVVLLTLA